MKTPTKDRALPFMGPTASNRRIRLHVWGEAASGKSFFAQHLNIMDDLDLKSSRAAELRRARKKNVRRNSPATPKKGKRQVR